MAPAHVCWRCGAALTRVRPQRDPHYGLALVFCPGCGSPWLRRVELMRSPWRRARPLVKSLAVLALQVVVLAILTSGAVGMVASLESMPLESMPLNATALARHRLELAGVAVWCVLCGAWLTAGLRHWKWRCAWSAWGAMLAVLQGIPLWDADVGPLLWVRLADRLASVGLILILAMAGIPAGLVVLRLHRANRRARLRLRRRNLRVLWRGA